METPRPCDEADSRGHHVEPSALAAATIHLLFEFPTLNGGERSMLSVLKLLAGRTDLQFRALCPTDGPLAKVLTEFQIPVHKFEVRDAAGQRHPNAALIEQLTEICHQDGIRFLHANSLAMSRLTGQVPASRLPAGMRRTGHLRDIVGLSRKAISDLNNNDALVAVSEATRTFHCDQGLRRCHVIYNGVDASLFQQRDRREARAAVLPEVPTDSTVVLNVGQICLRKGQLDAADAVASLKDASPEIHLVIAGERHSSKAESVAFEQAVHAAFSAAGQGHRLHMLGFRCDVPRLMNAADLLVHAARQEPFGRVLLEASASGLPIVATDVGGTRELLRPDVDALLVPPKQPAALAAGIQRLADAPHIAANLAMSARQRIRQHFTVELSANALAAFWLRERAVPDEQRTAGGAAAENLPVTGHGPC